MAMYNEILVGRFNRLCQKLFSMKGGAVIPQLAADIQPTLNFRLGVDTAYLEGWKLCGSADDVTGGVGQIGGVDLRNPVGSNVIAVVSKLSICNLTVSGNGPQAFTVSVGLDSDGLGTDRSSFLLDARAGQTNMLAATSVMSDSVNAVADLVAIVNRVNLANPNSAAGQAVYEQVQYAAQEIPLLPGFGIRVRPSVSNTRFLIGFLWRERFLEDSERT